MWEVKPESVKPNSELVTGSFTLPNSPTSNPNDPTYLDVVHSTITVEGLKVATPESVEVNNDRGELIINVRRDDLTDANGEIGTEFTLKLRFFSSAGPQFQATDDVGPPGGRGLPPVSCAVSSHGRQGTVLRSVPVALLLAGLWLGFYRFRRHRG